MNPFENFQHEEVMKLYPVSILDSLRFAVRDTFAEEVCSKCLYAHQGICGEGRRLEIHKEGDKDSNGRETVRVRCINFLQITRDNKMKLAIYLLEVNPPEKR